MIILKSLICILVYLIDFSECLMLPIDSCGTSPGNATLECNITFSGNFAPLIQWVNSSGDVVIKGVITANHSDRVTSTLVKEINDLSLPLDYTCRANTSKASCKPSNSAHCES